MHKLAPYLSFFFGLFFSSAPLAAQEQATKSATSYKILFIGNSLSYSNNLPLLVSIAGEKQQLDIATEIIAKPNYALIDHLEEGSLETKIENESFDFVIVQQGPSSQEAGRKLLFEAVQKLTKVCKKNQSQLAIFMVWPSQQYYHTFDKVIKNHREVAEKYQAVLCPVGEVWKTHFETTKDFSYYSTDGFHPSKKGSQAAAEIIISSLFDI